MQSFKSVSQSMTKCIAGYTYCHTPVPVSPPPAAPAFWKVWLRPCVFAFKRYEHHKKCVGLLTDWHTHTHTKHAAIRSFLMDDLKRCQFQGASPPDPHQGALPPGPQGTFVPSNNLPWHRPWRVELVFQVGHHPHKRRCQKALWAQYFPSSANLPEIYIFPTLNKYIVLLLWCKFYHIMNVQIYIPTSPGPKNYPNLHFFFKEMISKMKYKCITPPPFG